MIELVAVFLVCLTAAIILHWMVQAWEHAQRQKSDDATKLEKIENRRLDLLEREVQLKEKLAIANTPAPPMPMDLVNRIRMWEDPIAQDNEKATLLEMYGEFQSWDLVRRHLLPLSPRMETEIVAPRDGLVQ